MSKDREPNWFYETPEELAYKEEEIEDTRRDVAFGEMADGYLGHKYNQKRTNRRERRRAKQNPDATPGYRRWRGYES